MCIFIIFVHVFYIYAYFFTIYMIFMCCLQLQYLCPSLATWLFSASGGNLQGPQSYLGSWSLRRSSQLSENSFPAFARHRHRNNRSHEKKNSCLGYVGDNWVVVSNIVFFTPKIGEDSHFGSYFSRGLKPPTRK